MSTSANSWRTGLSIVKKSRADLLAGGTSESVLTEGPYLRIKVRGQEDKFPTLLDVSSFLYDFNLLYELLRLAVDDRYADYRFNNRFSGYRDSRRLDDEDRLHVVRLQHESPIYFDLIVSATSGAFVAVAGLLYKVLSPREREKRKLEIEKLRLEVENARDQRAIRSLDQNVITMQIKSREAEYIVDRTTRRLEGNPVKVREIEVEIVQGPPRKDLH